jgi:hypothetical protein
VVSKKERHIKDSLCKNKTFMICQGCIRIDGIGLMKCMETTVAGKVWHVGQKQHFKNSVQPAGTSGDF